MEIIKNIILVIISPAVGWDEVNRAGTHENRIISKAYIPMLVILAITAFIPMIYDKISFSHAFLNSLLEFFIYFLGYFISSYLLSGFYPELVKTPAGQGRMNTFVLYNLMYLVILSILDNLMPIEFTPILFMTLYVMWTTTKGVDFLGLKEEKTIKFVFVASAMFLLMPFVISLLIHKE